MNWSLSPSLGTLSATSGTGAVYTPPAVGGLSAATAVTITATPASGSPVALQLTVTLAPFAVSSTTPGPTGHVSASTLPTVQFSRALAPAVSASAVSLSSPVASVPASMGVSGSTLTLMPASGLVWGGHYTVSLGSGVASAVGQALAPASFSFDVAPPSWGTPQAMTASKYTQGTPVVAFDKSGHGFAVWQQDTDGTGLWNLQAASFNLAGRSWSTPVALHAGSGVQVAPAIASDAEGNVIAVWCEGPLGGASSLYAARYVAAQASWGPATVIQNASGQTVQAPQIVLDAAGNGTVVWQQYKAIGSVGIHAARFDAGSAAWKPAVQLDTGVNAENPQAALDASGNVIAVWEQVSSGGQRQIAAARWSQSTAAWGTAQLVQPSALAGWNPQLAVAANGDGTAVWTQTEANQTLTIQAARFSAATGAWSPPVALSPATGVSGGSYAQVQADLGGNVIALWQQYQSPSVYSMDAARFDAASGQWGPTTHLDTVTPSFNMSPFAWPPKLVIDPAGNATASWTQQLNAGSGIYNEFHARFDGNTRTWSAASSLAGSASINDEIPLAVDAQGNVLACWAERDTFGKGTAWWALLTGG